MQQMNLTPEEVLQTGRQLAQKIFYLFPAEERMAGLSTQERIAGLSLQERMAGLKLEEVLSQYKPEEVLSQYKPEELQKAAERYS